MHFFSPDFQDIECISLVSNSFFFSLSQRCCGMYGWHFSEVRFSSWLRTIPRMWTILRMSRFCSPDRPFAPRDVRYSWTVRPKASHRATRPKPLPTWSPVQCATFPPSLREPAFCLDCFRASGSYYFLHTIVTPLIENVLGGISVCHLLLNLKFDDTFIEACFETNGRLRCGLVHIEVDRRRRQLSR